MKGNILIRFGLVAFIAICIGVGVFASRGSSDTKEVAENTSASSESPQETVELTTKSPEIMIGGEADTVIDTQNALINKTTNLTQRFDNTSNKVEQLQQTVELLRNQLEATSQQQQESAEQEKTEYQNQLELLAKQLVDIKGNMSLIIDKSVANKDGADFGVLPTETPNLPTLISPNGSSALSGAGVLSQTESTAKDEIIWIDPLDATLTEDKKGNIEVTLPSFKGASFEGINPFWKKTKDTIDDKGSRLTKAANLQRDSKESETLTPFFTVPSDTYFFNAVTSSALIGRIPVDNKVVDPYRFNVRVGHENITANNHTLSEIEHAIVSGSASGDANLQCVKGTIDRITFVFWDGTIRTISDENIGYITDQYSVPCVSGLFITNFPKFITQTGVLGGIAGTTEALATAQTTVKSGTDTTTSSVTGDTLNYALGSGAAQGVSSVVDQIVKRQQSIYDAVFAEAGIPINIYIEKELHIDYDTEGRKVRHHAENSSSVLYGLN